VHPTDSQSCDQVIFLDLRVVKGCERVVKRLWRAVGERSAGGSGGRRGEGCGGVYRVLDVRDGSPFM